jgi:hypothetical protein
MRAEAQAFAKVVPSGKTFICALQMAKKHLALLVAFCEAGSQQVGRQCFKSQTEIKRENVMGKFKQHSGSRQADHLK